MHRLHRPDAGYKLKTSSKEDLSTSTLPSAGLAMNNTNENRVWTTDPINQHWDECCRTLKASPSFC